MPAVASAFLLNGERIAMNINSIQPQAAAQASGSNNTTSTSGALPSSGSLNNMFLQLLVAQLQHQSPLDPMDPTQFVGQLAQFSELSEVTSIDQTLQQIVSTSVKPHASQPVSPSAASFQQTSDTNAGAQPPQAMVSAAVAAAQASAPIRSLSSSSILNSKVQGVF